MHVKILSILAFAGAALADVWAGFEDLPDGPYAGVTHPDGSVTLEALDKRADMDNFTFHLERAETSPVEVKRSDYALQKRKTSDCWGYELDHQGVDGAAQALRDWAGAGHQMESGDQPFHYGFNVKGVYVYYCLNAPHESGNLDVGDVDFALHWMDSDCGMYQASYFWWPGHAAEVVGKARSGTSVCQV